MMNMNEYQELAQKTANTSLKPGERIAIAGLGLGGEAGEVQELLKKFLGHGHALAHDKLKKELGDVLWYVAELATIHGMTLGEIAQANIEKLAERFPEGFTEWHSRNRKEYEDQEQR